MDYLNICTSAVVFKICQNGFRPKMIQPTYILGTLHDVVGGFWVNTWEMSGKGQFLQEVVSNDPYFRNPQFRRFFTGA